MMSLVDQDVFYKGSWNHIKTNAHQRHIRGQEGDVNAANPEKSAT
jgi:hypothetical protein